MPVKRRKSKRMATASLETWELYLECGTDYFDDLADAGIAPKGERPSDDIARAAWLAYADELLDRWRSSRHVEQGVPWALERFGDPRVRRRR
ncbi:hypothetical protein G8E10_04870 [Rhizobiaceae bacterium CRRU44]|uniref:Uncharacterized protein n=1 Tax=Ferranicluibacter rubi TaxID=2715133 RepID=A0AA43ZCJ7_9HYPH|nr:hypothetical protein [Ferranicluibacter rubi]NHT75089.1 hypothetical protein [Ferranicluibacter rubi]